MQSLRLLLQNQRLDSQRLHKEPHLYRPDILIRGGIDQPPHHVTASLQAGKLARYMALRSNAGNGNPSQWCTLSVAPIEAAYARGV